MEVIMASPQSHQTVEKQSAVVLVSGEGISEPGGYVETQTGRLYRIPQEALLAGSSPLIRQNCNEGPTYIQRSRSPYITVFAARMLAAEHTVEPRF
jgi:hypothetical protein